MQLAAAAAAVAAVSIHRQSLAFAPPDPAGRRLLQWLGEEGASISTALDVVLDPQTGRELVVSEAVEAGEELVKLTPELSWPVPVEKEAEEDGMSGLTVDVQLAACIAEEADSEDWRHYRAVWPSPEDLAARLPVFWEPERFDEFPALMPRLEAEASARRQLLLRVAPRLGIAPQRLLWAHALVSTRAVGASQGACAMIPGVDLANHSPDPNTQLVVAGVPGIRNGRATLTSTGQVWEHGAAGLVTKRALAAGEAVRISYGEYPNERLLLDYGFSLGQANPKGDVGLHAT